MIWNELLLNKKITSFELCQAFSEVFFVASTEIAITGNIEKQISENIKILCHTFVCATDFPLRLAIYIRDENLASSLSINDQLLVVGKLAERLSVTILISDSSINPYKMLKVTGLDCYEEVFVDLSDYDSCEETEI